MTDCHVKYTLQRPSKTRKQGAFQIILPQRVSKTGQKKRPQYYVPAERITAMANRIEKFGAVEGIHAESRLLVSSFEQTSQTKDRVNCFDLNSDQRDMPI